MKLCMSDVEARAASHVHMVTSRLTVNGAGPFTVVTQHPTMDAAAAYFHQLDREGRTPKVVHLESVVRTLHVDLPDAFRIRR